MEEHDMPFSLQMGSIFLHAFTTRPSWFTIPRLVKKISQMMPLHFPSHPKTVQYIMTPSLHGLRDQGSSPLSNPFQLDNGNVTGIVTFGMDRWLYFNANFFMCRYLGQLVMCFQYLLV